MNVETVTVYIGMGSNLENPIQQLRNAIQAMGKYPETSFIRCSSFYESEPMGPQNQPNYINAVAQIETGLSAHELLEHLNKTEEQQGRVRGERWVARTLDLDLLLYGEVKIQTTDLTVPHVGIEERNFVLYPLKEVGLLKVPGLGFIDELVDKSPSGGLTKLREPHG